MVAADTFQFDVFNTVAAVGVAVWLSAERFMNINNNYNDSAWRKKKNFNCHIGVCVCVDNRHESVHSW